MVLKIWEIFPCFSANGNGKAAFVGDIAANLAYSTTKLHLSSLRITGNGLSRLNSVEMWPNQNNFSNSQTNGHQQMKKKYIYKWRKQDKNRKWSWCPRPSESRLQQWRRRLTLKAQWVCSGVTTCWFSRERLPLLFLWPSALIVATKKYALDLNSAKQFLTATLQETLWLWSILLCKKK